MSTQVKLVRSLKTSCRRAFAKTLSIPRRFHSTFPISETCPPPTCSCTATPPDLDIDRTSSLANTAPSYTQHVVIATGKNDWASKIELEPDEADGGVNVAAGLKGLLGRGGKWHDPTRPILITNANFPSLASEARHASTTDSASASAYLFPSFKHISGIEKNNSGLDSFVATHLLPGANKPSGQGASTGDPVSESLERPSTQAPSQSTTGGTASPLSSATILICGHGGRDRRCGILGPLLKVEFERQLAIAGLSSHEEESPKRHGSLHLGRKEVAVGLVSHIGGHKWAGNVIVYIPPAIKDAAGVDSDGKSSSPLAGRGVWYGRVEPKHVEGIVKETLVGGRVIRELCRGVV